MRAIPLTLTCAALAACTQFPALDDTLTDEARRADYPALVPVETLATQAQSPRIAPETEDSLAARVAALRARADRLRGAVLDSTSRARLSQDVTID